jgi:hypothetical protein
MNDLIETIIEYNVNSKHILLCTAGFSYCGTSNEKCTSVKICAFHHTKQFFVDSQRYEKYRILIPVYSDATRKLQDSACENKGWVKEYAETILYESIAREFMKLYKCEDGALSVAAKSAGAGWVLRLIRLMKVAAYYIQAPSVLFDLRAIQCDSAGIIGWCKNDNRIPPYPTNLARLLKNINMCSSKEVIYIEYDGSSHNFHEKFFEHCLLE